MPEPPESPEQARTLHRMAVELAAMSQNGLNYSTDKYDIDRYVRLRDLSAELLGLLGGSDGSTFRAALAAEAGHATPKVDVRGAVFDAADRVLLVREKRDGLWTLPGGWADALDAPSEAVEREVREEAGLVVRASKLAFVHDGSLHNGHAGSPWHIYKLFFLLELTVPGDPVAGLDGETIEADYFAIDALPHLSPARTNSAQLELALAHHRMPERPTEYD